MDYALKKIFLTIFLLGILGASGACGWLLFKDQKAPEMIVTPDSGRLSAKSSITVSLSDPSGIRSVIISVTKNSRTTVVHSETFAAKPQNHKVELNLSAAKLQDGVFDLLVKSTDGSFAGFDKGNSATQTYSMRMDTSSPRVSINTMPPNVRRGGVAVIAFTTNEELSSALIRVNDLEFPAYRQEDGKFLCFFAFPYFLTPKDFVPRLEVTDIAGNTTVRGIGLNALNKKLKEDIIRIPDSFLNRKMPQYEKDIPGQMTQLERFLKVNREMRVANRSALLSIGRQTSPEMLWDKRFLRLPNAANRAGFAEHRTYVYKGETVDEQYHLGHDLASTRNALVPAAANGNVVFADFFGIYGNCVIIDHGLGLQTLYSHLSEISVTPGQALKRGETIGKTGATGMAGGDHLHFGVILSGMPVNPLEWFDGRWIRHNITDRLAQ